MRAAPFDQDDAIAEANLYHQPVRVALDVEDDPVVSQEAGCHKPLLHVMGTVPARSLNFSAPRIECTSRICMCLLQFLKHFQVGQMHWHHPSVPSWDEVYIPKMGLVKFSSSLMPDSPPFAIVSCYLCSIDTAGEGVLDAVVWSMGPFPAKADQQLEVGQVSIALPTKVR